MRIDGPGYLVSGYVDLQLLLSLLIGFLPGMTLGSKPGTRVPEQTLQLLLIGLGVNYVI